MLTPKLNVLREYVAQQDTTSESMDIMSLARELDFVNEVLTDETLAEFGNFPVFGPPPKKPVTPPKVIIGNSSTRRDYKELILGPPPKMPFTGVITPESSDHDFTFELGPSKCPLCGSIKKK